MPPLRFLINCLFRDASQTSDHLSIDSADPGGHPAPRRFIHEGHKLIRESRHCAADANSPNVRAAADAADPAALRHVAFDYRSPAADLDQAFWRAVFSREIALLVISCSVTTFMHRLTEEPSWAQLLIQW